MERSGVRAVFYFSYNLPLIVFVVYCSSCVFKVAGVVLFLV